MKRILIYIILAVLGVLLLNIAVATCLLFLELSTHFGQVAQVTNNSPEFVASYFHFTGYSMFAMLVISFYLLWEGPDLKKHLKKDKT